MLAFYLARLDGPAEKSTFRDFYMDYRQLMYRTALNILKDPHLAEDAVQEAFLSILPHMVRLRGMGEGQKEGFAVVVARNKAVDLLRKKNRAYSWEELDENTLAVEFEFEIDDPDRILGQLPFRYAQVMRLVGLGFRPNEIAQITQTPVRTIYQQIARGKKLLGGILEKEGYHGRRSDGRDDPPTDPGMGCHPA